ncbi:MAG: hypothetical protein E7012_05820 [Alphaproteobacteria bacterium]|nr:hypothetical protein [Alphaproteobacteria bacterium]
MQKFSLHTHTIGFDGHNTEEEMLSTAQELGWNHIGFSNHFIVHPNIKDAPMYQYALKGGYNNIYSSSFDEVIAKFEPHYKKIDELRQTTDINILKGMEVDFFATPEWREGFEQAINHLKPDYLIGTAHFVVHNNILYNSHDIKSSPKIEQNQLLHRYWQNERAAAQSGLFLFMAHLDLIKKVGLGQEDSWAEEEVKTIKAIKQSGVMVELNTGYYKFGPEPYPSKRIMKMLAQENIPVLISDDAHTIKQLGNKFAEVEQLAKDNGINKFFKLTKNSNFTGHHIYSPYNKSRFP